jgi:hypothetical protein
MHESDLNEPTQVSREQFIALVILRRQLLFVARLLLRRPGSVDRANLGRRFRVDERS